MPNLNQVNLIGLLTRDVELKYTSSGLAIGELSIAVNRNWTTESGEKRTEVAFIDITLFGRNADLASQYLKKASPVYIGGHIMMDTWDDKQTGAKRSRLKVVGDTMQFLGSRPKASEPSGEPQPSAALQEQRARNAAAAPAFKPVPSPAAPAPAPRSTDIDPGDIPF